MCDMWLYYKWECNCWALIYIRSDSLTCVFPVLCVGHPVWGEHARRALQHPWRDTTRWCDPSRWWSDHPHGPSVSLRLCAHGRTKAARTCLSRRDPGKHAHVICGMVFGANFSFLNNLILIFLRIVPMVHRFKHEMALFVNYLMFVFKQACQFYDIGI